MFDWLTSHHLLHDVLRPWAYAALFALLGYVVVRWLLRLVAARLRNLARRTANLLLDAAATALERTKGFLLFAIFVLLASRMLGFSSTTMMWLGRAVVVLAGVQLGMWMNSAIQAWSRGRVDRTETRNPVVMAMLAWIVRILVWATIVLAVLANSGVNITAFIASLGVGGVAVALALQNVLGDLFASLSIGLDKPFGIGDFIVFGDIAGTITKVGVKTTRVRSLSGEEVIVGNADLLKHTVHNYARMVTRRIVYGFGVTYGTPADLLQAIPDTVREIFGEIAKVKLDRAHFKGFGASSLDFEVVYIVQDPDYNLYMDIQQTANLALVRRLHAMGVEFALPTRTLHVSTIPPHTRDKRPEETPGDTAATH